MLDIDEKLYVFDPANRRIQRYNLDGIQLAEWSIPDSGAEESVLNNALALDPLGNVYLLEGNHVLLVDTEGNLLSKWDGNGRGAGQSSRAADLSFDSVGNLYVLDANRVQKFVPVDQSEPSAISLASGQNQAFTGLRSGRYTFTALTPNAWDELNIECNNWTGPIQIADGLGIELNGQDVRCAFIDAAESVGDRPTTTLILPPTPTPLPTLIPTSAVTPTPEELLPSPSSTSTPVFQPTSGITSTATPLPTAEEQPILTGTLTAVPTPIYSATPLMTATPTPQTPTPQTPSATSIVTPTQPPSTPTSTSGQSQEGRFFLPIIDN